jgi:hypothetical protein
VVSGAVQTLVQVYYTVIFMQINAKKLDDCTDIGILAQRPDELKASNSVLARPIDCCPEARGYGLSCKSDIRRY